MTKKGKATPAPVETTTSGRYRRSTFQESFRFRSMLGMFRVVGWYAHSVSSPARSESASGFSNVTQRRS